MKTAVLSTCILTLLLLPAPCVRAQETPPMPQPAPEHEWLQRFAGEWEYEVEIFIEPGQPPFKASGTESARMIGGFWVVGHGKGDLAGMPFVNITTFGYDPAKKKYIGTGIDSGSSTLWQYEGTVDPAGKTLTFETQGPCPIRGGRMTKFRGVIEFKSDDHRVFTYSALGDDGEWETTVIVNSRRAK